MVKASFGRPCHVPPYLINEEGGSNSQYISSQQDCGAKLPSAIQ